MTSLVTVQKEVKKIKQKVHPDEPKDTWISWSLEIVTHENVEEIKAKGFREDPDDMMETIRVTTRAHPNPVKFRCKRRDISRKIAEIQNREQRQS